MKLTVVGCSGSAPGPKSPASSYLVEHDGFRLHEPLGRCGFPIAYRAEDLHRGDLCVIKELAPVEAKRSEKEWSRFSLPKFLTAVKRLVVKTLGDGILVPRP